MSCLLHASAALTQMNRRYSDKEIGPCLDNLEKISYFAPAGNRTKILQEIRAHVRVHVERNLPFGFLPFRINFETMNRWTRDAGR